MATIYPVDEIEERLLRAQSIASQIRCFDYRFERSAQVLHHFHLDTIQLAAMLVTDIQSLRTAETELPERFHCRSVEALIAAFFHKESNTEPGHLETQHRQDFGQREIALTRDRHHCVVSGSREPDVCYIWPFGANNPADRDAMRVLCERNGLLLNQQCRLRMSDMFSEHGHPDESWNMISLSPTLRQSWGRDFAFKWAGVATQDDPLYSTVLLEWYWLPGSISRAVEAYYLPGEDLACQRGLDLRAHGAVDDIYWSLRDMMAQTTAPVPTDAPGYLDRITQWPRGPATATKAVTDSEGRPIQNGSRIPIRVLSEHIDKTKDVIELQWIVARIAALSGAAQVADSLSREAPRVPWFQLPVLTGLSEEYLRRDRSQAWNGLMD